MPKPEIEFVDMDTHYGWRTVEGDTLGIKEKILSFEAKTQSYTRLLKFPPGIKTSETLVHDFWEEVLIVEGELMDLAKKQTFGAGFYACRPPGMKHGPYHIPRGCITFEIRYFLGKDQKGRESLEGKSLRIWVSEKDREREQLFKMRRMVNAGYTGRDQEKIREHIEELEKEGVPAPASTPTAYEVISQGITFDTEIEVVGEKTSGEAEYVLLCSGNEVYVGVGSDHTDRELESVSIIKSKQVCPNILSRQVWKLKEVRKNWDTMILRNRVKNERGEKILYQEAPLSALMSPEDLMKFVQNSLDDGNLDGVVIFSGTIPILTEKIHYSESFEVELEDPRTARRIQCAYGVKVLDYLKGGRG